MADKEIFFSIDVETNGPIPGENSMLNYGCAAMDIDGNIISTFENNLITLSDSVEDPETMKFWAERPEVYKRIRQNLISPLTSMENFTKWARAIDQYPVAVAYPAGFDFTFIYWYLTKFTGKSAFSFSCIDVKTFAMSLMKTGYKDSVKRNMPKRWFSNDKHTHTGLDDAIGQGRLFVNMLKESRNDSK